MEFQETNHGAVTVLKPIGPVTAADADAFRQRAADIFTNSRGRFVVDASGVPFVDSRGVEVLVDVTEQMSDSGRSLKLCGASDTLREVLNLTGWATSFEFFDDVQVAVRSFL